MSDSFPEDSASEAKGEVEEEAAEEMAGDEEDMDDGGPDAEEPEQLSIKLQGCYCRVFVNRSATGVGV
jgi:hypothetical protein